MTSDNDKPAEAPSVIEAFDIGQIMSAIGLITEGQAGGDPERVREGRCGNLCRCGAYRGITEAVIEATHDMTVTTTREDAA